MGERNDLCATCAEGTFQPAAGSTACSECLDGHRCPEGSSIPLPATCPAGTHVAGNFSSEDDCQDCETGHECPGGFVQPSECRPGSIAPTRRWTLDGVGRCEMCEPGTYQNASGATACEACRAGSYCPRGSSAPLACEAGSYSNATDIASAAECIPTDAGFSAPTSSVAQTPCAPGTVAPGARSGACTRCPAGEYQDAEGQMECKPCDRGFYCEEGAAAPLPCPGGTHMNASLEVMLSVEQCVVCPKGTFCSIGSDDPTPCAPGTFSPFTNATRCQRCPAGEYQDAERQTHCKPCDRGSYCAAGASTPFPCPAGRFGNATDMAAATECLPCPAGSSCALGSTEPSRCLPGTYTDESNQSRCLTCSPGDFTSNTGSTSCQRCAPGMWCTSAAQIPCSENTYNPDAGAYLITNCTRCPERTTTLGRDAQTSVDGCSCSVGFYKAPPDFVVGRDECIDQCCSCPVSGTRCTNGSITLIDLPIAPGYFRPSDGSVDVRRCPDAAVNCSGRSECAWSTSGCQGGRDGNLCREGLTGTFCRSCVEDFHFYQPAETGVNAHCKPCVNVSSSRGGTLLIAAASVALAAIVVVLVVRRLTPERKQRVVAAWHYMVDVHTLPTKLKIVIGFYQIATRVESVYAILLPEQVRLLLFTLQLAISLGIDGIPLACVGAAGYYARLVFWMVSPLVAVSVVTCVGAARVLAKRGRRTSVSKMLNGTAPAALRVFFLAYPIATNVAFDAFSCYDFQDGASYLVADVTIRCGSDEHWQAKRVAILGILLYPIGLIVLNGSLLVASREAILVQRPSALSRATAFLHREYKRVFYLWELAEMLRRFLLVGAYVVGPYHPGSMMQLALASVTCVLFLVLQTQSMPYAAHTDNYLAIGCSLSLVVLFIASIFYKVAALTELKELQDIMTFEQQEDFVLHTKPLTAVLILSIISALILSAVVIAIQAGQHALQLEQQRRTAKARRLRFRSAPVSPARLVRGFSAVAIGADDEVPAPPIDPQGFHCFLSHVWGTGQDQMRIVKQRLLEMVPDFSVFLEYARPGSLSFIQDSAQ